jgi:hypothetical protein
MKREEMTMKRHLVVCAALAALALPGVVQAEQNEVGSSAGMAAFTEEGRVDVNALTHLLEQKGLITPQEEKALTRRNGTPSIDDETMRHYFDTPPYRRGGWQGGPSGVSG